MSKESRRKEVHRGKGALGTPNQVTSITVEDRSDLKAALVERGRGAWVGRTRCDEPPAMAVFGGPWVTFARFPAAAPSLRPPGIGVVRERHAGDYDDLLKDVPADRLASRSALYAKVCRDNGWTEDRAVYFADIDDLVENLGIDPSGRDA